MVTGQDIAREAFEKLQKSIQPSDVRAFSNTTYGEVLQAIEDVQNAQAARGDLRYARRIEPLIDTINGYSDIFTILCQGWPPMSFIWGPIRWILLLAKNYFDIIDTILQAYKDIADNLPRIDRLKKTFPEDQRLHQTVGWIYSDLLEFHGRAYKIFRRRLWHFYFAFDWGLYRKRFNSVLLKLSRHCDIVDKEAAAAHFAEMRIFRDQRRDEDQEFEKRRRLKMFQDVLSWLSESEDAQEEYLHKLSDARQLNTCNWILKDPDLVHWIDNGSNDNTLWISGKPGSGKSYHVSMIVENVRGRHSESCAFFFCGYDNSADVSCVKILRTFSRQILSKHPDLAPIVHEAFLQKGSCRTTIALKRLLIQILPEIESTQFVLDGLDELDVSVQEETLKSLNDIMKSNQVNMGLLVSSRTEPQIKKFTFHRRIELEEKTNQGLTLYIQNKVKRLRDDHKYIDALLSDEITTHLSGKADGMFLWVRLVFEMLNDKGSENEMRAAIYDLPDGLEEAYGRIISRIEKKLSPYLRRRVLKILPWLCVSRRLVSIHEVVDGIALDFGQKELNRQTRISNPDRDIIDLCAPLLEKSQSGTLRLVHFSAKEYLLSSQSGTGGPFLEETLSHFSIAQSCIINLVSAIDFIPSHSNMSQIELQIRTVGAQYGLVPYASDFWVDHLLSYLSDSERFDSDKKNNILLLLRSLRRLIKRHTGLGRKTSVLGMSSKLSKGLKQLENEPDLYQLVVSCFEIPAKLRKVKANLDDPEQQEEQLLLGDDTFTTFVSCHLRDTTNHILKMPNSALPLHIGRPDYEAFVKRFGWRCKYMGCLEEFKSEVDKKKHERSHVISFPCSYCDFFINGFRSKRDLDRHVKNYHLDFNSCEVPDSLHFGDDSALEGSKATFLQKRPQRCWNQRGLKASQAGLKQILKSIRITTSNDPKDDGSQQFGINSLGRKIEEHQYESLESFKQDLRQTIEGAHGEDESSLNEAIESACQHGLKNTMVDYPGFASLEINPLTSAAFGVQNPLDAINLDRVVGSGDVEDLTRISLSDDLLNTQDIYWSKIEKTEFPDLLKTFGSDFRKIAEQLGTKSREDVDVYYTSLIGERPELEEIALQTDLNSQSMEYGDHAPTFEPIDHGHSGLALSGDPAATFPTPAPVSGNLVSIGLPEPISSQHFQQTSTTNTPGLPLEQADSKGSKLPVRKKRVRPRAYCSECNYFPGGLHDEYALQKHVDRYHRPNRKVWTCNDVSINKSFLQGCDVCLIGKRYKTKHDASKHLRKIHFSPASTSQTLHRWLLEDEEPNPSYGLPPGSRPSRTMPKRKRTGNDDSTHRIAPLRIVVEGESLLPSMRTNREKAEIDNRKRLRSDSGLPSTGMDMSFDSFLAMSSDIESSDSSPGAASRAASPLENDSSEESAGFKNDSTDVAMVDAGKSEAKSKADVESYENLLPDVSFDNMIGMRGISSKYYDPNGPPHRSKRELIKPDQVPRLPHLDQARKLIYSDQVLALYYRLDHEGLRTGRYKERLEKLEELSRTLMRNLKDWQREQSRAPHIPFSLN